MNRLSVKSAYGALLLCVLSILPLGAMEEEIITEEETVLTETRVPSLFELAIKPAALDILDNLTTATAIRDVVMPVAVTSRVNLVHQIIQDKRYPGNKFDKLALAYQASQEAEFDQILQLDALFDEAIKNIDSCEFVEEKLKKFLPGYNKKILTVRDWRLITAILHKAQIPVPTKRINHPLLTIKSAVSSFKAVVSPDGSKVVFSVGLDTWCIWSIKENKPLALFKVPDQKSFIHMALAWLPDSNVLALGLSDGSVHFFASNAFENPEIVRISGISPSFHLIQMKNEFARTLYNERVKQVPDQHKEVIQGFANQNPKDYLEQQNVVQVLTLSGANKRPFTWYLQRSDVQAPIQFSTGKKGIERLSFSPEGNYLVTLSEDSTVRVWDIKDVMKKDKVALAAMGPIFDKKIKGEPIAVTLSKDANRIAIAPSEQKVLVFDTHKGKLLVTLDTNAYTESYQDHGANALALSKDGKLMAYPYKEKATVYDLVKKEVVSEVDGVIPSGPNYVFSPGASLQGNDTLVAFTDEGVDDSTTEICSLRFGTTRKVQLSESDYPCNFSDDGHYLATWFTSISIWQLPVGFLLGDMTWDQLFKLLKKKCEKVKK